MLETWVDFELIERCAIAFPQASLVIIGEPKTDISPLFRHSNITWLDHVPYKELPRYAEKFDVGLIPRRINRLTLAMNPIKLLEYLALELPVVSTNLPEMSRYEDLVSVARDHDHFVRLVGEALDDNSPGQRRKRRTKAERYSWDSVADQFSEAVREIDDRKVRGRKSRADSATVES